MLESLASGIGSGFGTVVLYAFIASETSNHDFNQWIAAGLFTAGTVAGLASPAITSMA